MKSAFLSNYRVLWNTLSIGNVWIRQEFTLSGQVWVVMRLGNWRSQDLNGLQRLFLFVEAVCIGMQVA